MKLLCIPVFAILFFFRQCTETVTVITSGPGGTVRSSSVQFDFTATAPFECDCSITGFSYSLDNGPVQIIFFSGERFREVSASVSFPGLSEGSHTFVVRANLNFDKPARIETRTFYVALDPANPVAGTHDTGFTASTDGEVDAIAVQPDGKTLIAGSFSSVHGQPRACIARLEANGALDPTFNSGLGPSNYVVSMALQPNGSIVLGGEFGDGETSKRITRLNSTGAVDPTFDPGLGPNALEVTCVALQGDGRILVAGDFTAVDQEERNGIARLESNGAVDEAFIPGTEEDDRVFTMAIQANGDILLGGNFIRPDNAFDHLVRLSAIDGSRQSTATFNPGIGVDDFIETIAVQADGKILLGGNFVRADGQTIDRLVRLRVNGQRETTGTFNPGTGPSQGSASFQVNSIALQANGKILTGGYFDFGSSADPRIAIARLTAPSGDLENLSTFNPITGASESSPHVEGVALQGDGRIMFTSGPRIARLRNDTAPENLFRDSNGAARWQRDGAAPEIEQVTFEISDDGVTNWSLIGHGARIQNDVLKGWTSLPGLPEQGFLRARGRTVGGSGNRSSGLVEKITFFDTGGRAGETDGAGAPMTPIELWRQQTFGPDAGNPAIAGNLANPDFDGYLNQVEYAFGSNPLDPSSVPLIAGWFGTDTLHYIYQRSVAATDVQLGIEKSTNLSAWGNLEFTEEILGEDETTRTMQVDIPLDLNDPAQPRGFLRPTVTLIP